MVQASNIVLKYDDAHLIEEDIMAQFLKMCLCFLGGICLHAEEKQKDKHPYCTEREKKMTLKITDEIVGEGKVAEKGKYVLVHYRGTLESGKQFDSSYDRGEPLRFKLGVGQVIKGWDDGILGMKVGGKRNLFIPADLGYGSRGAGNVIPPNSNLIFDCELVDVID